MTISQRSARVKARPCQGEAVNLPERGAARAPGQGRAPAQEGVVALRPGLPAENPALGELSEIAVAGT